MLKPIISNIPIELQAFPQWVCWKAVPKADGQIDKVPYSPKTGRYAAVNRPSTWGTFEQAVAAHQNGKSYAGIGIVLTAQDPIAGVDLDDCINDAGEIKPWAQKIVKIPNTYTEISPSGTGLRMFLQGALNSRPGNKVPFEDGKIEVYDTRRFLTVTGHRVEGTPATVEARQGELEALHSAYVAKPKRPSKEQQRPLGIPLSDEDIISIASTAKNGFKFLSLYADGDYSNYDNDESRADQALCSMLAFYTQDFDQIERIFRGSRLNREKWETREDYREMTINKALAEIKEVYTGKPPQGVSPDQPARKTQADVLLKLIKNAGVDLFHDSKKATYMHVPVNDHKETWLTKAKAAKLWLSGRFYQATGRAPSRDTISQTMGVLESKALFDGPEVELALRVAERNGAFWYDLANDSWQAVKITPGHWEIIDRPPPTFIRGANTAIQVTPAQASWKEVFRLKDFINLKDDAQYLLFIVELISCLIPSIPHTISIYHGEKGAAKSTTMRIRRKLIDPAVQELQLLPKDINELVLTLSKNWMPSFDNLSGLPGIVSDVLCMAATGGGISKRELYTDADETILNFLRCVALNGISEPATRPDLLDRSLMFELERIPEETRKSESEFWRAFDEIRPLILGGMFTILADAMNIYPRVNLSRLPRMADFAIWGYAVAEAIYEGGGGDFMQAFNDNRSEANNQAINSNPIALAIIQFMSDREQWSGTAGELFTALQMGAYDAGIDQGAKSWPRSSKALIDRIKHVKSNLMDVGIAIREDVDKKKCQKKYVIENWDFLM